MRPRVLDDSARPLYYTLRTAAFLHLIVFISFILCHAIWDFLSSTDFLTFILTWKIFCRFFWQWGCLSSLWVFLCFCALAFAGFLLLHQDAIFTIRNFFQTISVSHGIPYMPLGLVGMHSTAASMWALTKFSFSSFEVCVSAISWRV